MQCFFIIIHLFLNCLIIIFFFGNITNSYNCGSPASWNVKYYRQIVSQNAKIKFTYISVQWNYNFVPSNIYKHLTLLPPSLSLCTGKISSLPTQWIAAHLQNKKHCCWYLSGNKYIQQEDDTVRNCIRIILSDIYACCRSGHHFLARIPQ